MRKTFAAVALFILVLFSAYAVDVSGHGGGETEQAALESARADLISQFSINVSSVTYTADRDDGQNAASSTMAAYSLQSTSFNLLGAQETTAQNRDGSWSATSTLTAAEAPLYEAQLNNLYSTITALYPTLDDNKPFETQKNTYLRLISALRDYETYQTVVLRLNPSSQIAMRSLPVTRVVVENEYQSHLVIENNNTAITLTSLQQQAAMGILSVQGQQELQSALAQMEENRRQQEELRLAAEQDYALQREEFQQTMAASIAQLQASFTADNLGTVSEEMSYSELINQIEANRATLQAIKDNVNSTLGAMESGFDDEAASTRRRMENEAYSASEMVNGQPTSTARNIRQNNINAAIEQIRTKYAPQANAIYEEAFGRMSTLTDYSLSYIDQLEKGSFTINSFAPEVNAYIDGYAEAASLFSGVADVTIGNSVITLYFRIPYTNWTGESVPSQRDVSAYNEYRQNAFDWLEIMQDFPEIFTVSLDFTVDLADDYSASYDVTFTSYSVTRNDTGEEVFTDRIRQHDTLEYSSRTRLNDFSITNDNLVDTSAFTYQRNAVGTTTAVPSAQPASQRQSQATTPAAETTSAGTGTTPAPAQSTSSSSSSKKSGGGLFSWPPRNGAYGSRTVGLFDIGGVYSSDYSTTSLMAMRVTLMPNSKMLSLGLQYDLYADFETDPIYTFMGVALSGSAFLPIGSSFVLFADVFAGGGWTIDNQTVPLPASKELNDFFFYAGADAGVGIAIGGYSLKLAGNFSWIDGKTFFGAYAGVAIGV